MIGSSGICGTLPGCYNSSQEWRISSETRKQISSVKLTQPKGLVDDNLEELTCSWCTYMVGQLAPVILNESGDLKVS